MAEYYSIVSMYHIFFWIEIYEEYSQWILEYQQKKGSGSWGRQVNISRSIHTSAYCFCVLWPMVWKPLAYHVSLFGCMSASVLDVINSSGSFLFIFVFARPRKGPLKALGHSLLTERWEWAFTGGQFLTFFWVQKLLGNKWRNSRHIINEVGLENWLGLESRMVFLFLSLNFNLDTYLSRELSVKFALGL